MYYLSDDTISAAYDELVKINYSNESILHIFFILKGSGFNNLSYTSISEIYNKGMEPCFNMSYLFLPTEVAPQKYDFINPFKMSDWANNPSEKMDKWLRLRVKNNILGGATTWRKIIEQNPLNEEEIKFRYSYIEEIKSICKIEQHINIIAFSVWTFRFYQFDKKPTKSELMNMLIKLLKLSDIERQNLFTSSSTFELGYESHIHNAELIRKKISNPPKLNNWSEPIADEFFEVSKMDEGKKIKMDRNCITSIEKIKTLLNENYQLILSGPPGTSKSYYAKKISHSYDEVINIQFHPQYTYQKFIGGYFVEQNEIKYQNGVILNLLENITQDKRYLLVIDEINRANLSQVFGEVVQLLDREYSIKIFVDGSEREIRFPKNLHIIGTMNTSDRSIGAIDHALRRRFMNVYFPSVPDVLIDICPSENFISLTDLLNKINSNIYEVLKNRELVIGHAIVLEKNVLINGKYVWNFDKFESLFNYKILPIIEEYCFMNPELVYDILGERLPKRLIGDEFISAIKEYLYYEEA